jgi:colanic acid/amylovoran biosynthesis glycosyltransferase
VRLAYLVSEYPATSHTFISREVRALRDLGCEITTFSVNAASPPERLSPADRAEIETTTFLKAGGPAQLARAVLRSAARRPGALLRTLRTALGHGRGLRGTLWQVFYLAEAVIVRDRCLRLGTTHVHAHFANNGADVARLVAELGRQAGERWTWSFTMHGPTEFADVERYGLAAKAAQADLVVCISRFARSQLMALTGPEVWDRFRIVHCGLELADWPLADRPDTERPVQVLCVGRLVPVKGQRLLLQALAAARADGHDLRLVLVGDGPDRASIEKEVADRGLADVVDVAGAQGVDGVQRAMGAADVFCLPSFQEGLPVVLMEAMATGLPVVTTRITGVPELVEDGVTGVLVTAGDVGALTAALVALAVDPARRRELGRRGRDRVAAEFDLAVVAPELRAAFSELVPT